MNKVRLLIFSTFLAAAWAASCGGSEQCDAAVARCMSDCPADSILQRECVEAFEVSIEAACEAALESFPCRVSTSTS